MEGVVRAEVENIEQLGQHPAVVRPVRAAKHRVNLLLEARAARSVLLHELRDRLLAGDGEDDVSHDPVGRLRGCLRDPVQDARLPADSLEVREHLLDDATLGLVRHLVGDLHEQLNEPVDEAPLARHAVENQQRQPDLVRVPRELPHALGRGATSVAFQEAGVERPQDAGRQRELAEALQLLHLSQQALEPDPAGIRAHPLERFVGEERVEPRTHPRVEPSEHGREDAFVVRMLRPTHDALEAVVTTRPCDLRLQQPGGDRFLQRVGVRLLGERDGHQPRAERLFRGIVERAHAEELEDRVAVSPPGAVAPLVLVERHGFDAELLGQMRDHDRGEFVPVLGEPSVQAVEPELRDEAEPADVLPPEEQVSFHRRHRPVLVQLLHRPHSLHRRLHPLLVFESLRAGGVLADHGRRA